MKLRHGAMESLALSHGAIVWLRGKGCFKKFKICRINSGNGIENSGKNCPKNVGDDNVGYGKNDNRL